MTDPHHRSAPHGQPSSRRDHLAGLAASLLASAIPIRAEATPPAPPLKDLASAKGVLFGSALGIGRREAADTRLMAIIARECGVIVPENEMKLYAIGDDLAHPNFASGDRVAKIARTQGQKLRGHTLLWNREEFMPRSLATRIEGRAAAETWLRRYVAGVCRHFGSQIHSWDVVNETVDPKTGELRDTLFDRLLGFDALVIAFETARDHAPHAQRVYNDYMSWERGNETHRRGVLKLLEQFRRRGVPVDALGIQSHIGSDGRHDQAQRREWQDFVEAVVAMGYDLLITEFDVNDRSLAGNVARRDVEAAAIAKDYLDRMLSFPQLTQFLCWGMVDRYSWLQGFAPRDDGAPQRPLPYGADYRAKPLYRAIEAALAAAPRRGPHI